MSALIGAHISVAGGLSRAIERLAAVEAEVAQVFVANSRAWAPPSFSAADDEAFRGACPVPVFVHAPYLINFGSPTRETLTRSRHALEFSLRRGAAIGAQGVVVHAGSAVLGNRSDAAMRQVRTHVLRTLDRVPGAPRLLIEPTAGGGGALAHDITSTAAYVAAFDGDERIGLCLDTCHIHAAGHDLSTAAGFGAALRAYGRVAPVGLVHVNDSRDPVGSKRDRHAPIGQGTIGAGAFGALFRSPATRRVPLVVETADTDHAADIATLKGLRAAGRATAPARVAVRAAAAGSATRALRGRA